MLRSCSALTIMHGIHADALERADQVLHILQKGAQHQYDAELFIATVCKFAERVPHEEMARWMAQGLEETPSRASLQAKLSEDTWNDMLEATQGYLTQPEMLSVAAPFRALQPAPPDQQPSKCRVMVRGPSDRRTVLYTLEIAAPATRAYAPYCT